MEDKKEENEVIIIRKEPWQDNLIASEISSEPEANFSFTLNYQENYIKGLADKNQLRNNQP